MNHVLVRYAEVGTKSNRVEDRLLRLLRDRVAERLAHEGVDCRVEALPGRLLVETDEARPAARAVAELPGVASSSPAVRTAPELAAVESAAERFEVGETFRLDATTAGDHGFSSQKVNEKVGAAVAEGTGAEVDLEGPDTRIEVDVRPEGAFVFTERFDGPGGFPVGSQDPLAALVSGGIDSPVAAYEAMTRGSEVVPVYCYNRPYAAGDHLVRFEAAADRLRRFHPGTDWYYYLVDMETVNERLQSVGSGQMLLHRAVMFRTAERIASDEGLVGLVTGESVGQKSSQTAANLARTSETVDLPVHRPLLTETKATITERARSLGTFEEAQVDSACRSVAPDSPATAMDRGQFDALAAEFDLDDLVETASESVERVEL